VLESMYAVFSTHEWRGTLTCGGANIFTLNGLTLR